MSEEKKEANPLDAQYGDWMTDFTKKENENRGSKNKIEWMKFDKPGKYKIRLVGKYVRYLKHFKPFGKGVRIITHPSYKKEDPAWKAGFYPGDSFVIHVIDRADGKLKLLDKGRMLFESFFDYGTANGIDPAGKDAPNFEIKVEWPNGNKNLARYSAVASGGVASLTDEEKENIRANRVDLGAIYRATPLEKIKEAWEAVPEQFRTPKKKGEEEAEQPKAKTAQKSPPAIEESMSTAPAEEDDLFGGEKATKEDETSW